MPDRRLAGSCRSAVVNASTRAKHWRRSPKSWRRRESDYPGAFCQLHSDDNGAAVWSHFFLRPFAPCSVRWLEAGAAGYLGEEHAMPTFKLRAVFLPRAFVQSEDATADRESEDAGERDRKHVAQPDVTNVANSQPKINENSPVNHWRST